MKLWAELRDHSRKSVPTHDLIKNSKPGRQSALAAWLLAVSAGMALTGCAVGPEFVKPEVAVQQDWTERDSTITSHASPDSAWWKAFNDSTLDRLIEIAYRQNLPLQVAGLRILEARAQLGIAVGRQYPQLQAIFGSAAAVGLSKHAPNSLLSDHNFWDYQLGFDAAWEVDFWRKYGQDVKAEEATFLASIADYDDALVSLTAEVARTYALIRTFEVLIDYARQNETIQEEGLRIAQSRFRNGATSELDVAQATTLLEGTRSSIPQLQISLVQTQNALCTLLGQTTGSLDALLAESQGIPAPPGVAEVTVPAHMLRRRPDIRAAEFLAMAQCARIGVAKAELYPSFFLFGSIGTQTSSSGGLQSGNSTFKNIFSAGSFFYSLGARIFYPLFNYGRITNNVRVQDARLQQLLVDYEDTVLRAAQEVEDGMVGYVRSQEATVFAQNAANGARRAVDLSFIQYREGAVDYQRVLDAQRSLLEEQNSLAETRSSVATNLIALYKALGGGWEMRVGQSVVPDSTQIEMQRRTNWGNLLSKPVPPDTPNGSEETR
jgi:NodT family efflux transporter outer membrane factor (OMF) lipoprotein